MSRGSCLVVISVALWGAGCRASGDDCRELALHVVALAQAEGKSDAAAAEEIEGACNEQRPTRGLVECMMGAHSLAALEGC